MTGVLPVQILRDRGVIDMTQRIIARVAERIGPQARSVAAGAA